MGGDVLDPAATSTLQTSIQAFELSEKLSLVLSWHRSKLV